MRTAAPAGLVAASWSARLSSRCDLCTGAEHKASLRPACKRFAHRPHIEQDEIGRISGPDACPSVADPREQEVLVVDVRSKRSQERALERIGVAVRIEDVADVVAAEADRDTGGVQLLHERKPAHAGGAASSVLE